MIYRNSEGVSGQPEIGNIYEGGKKEVELSGVSPISFNAIGSQLEDYLIEGNTSQNGTPTPDAPVNVVGCGERTGNLFDAATLENGIYLAASGNKYGNVTNGIRSGTKIKVLPNMAYTLSAQSSAKVSLRVFEWNNGTFVKQTPIYNVSGSVSLTVTTTAETTEIAFNIEGENGQHATSIMLNLGSTALPYEPYGYKITITVNGTEFPIYLGQVETTRRIKKLVLTGEEYVYTYTRADIAFRVNTSDMVASLRTQGYCSHFSVQYTPGYLTVDGITFGAGDKNLYFTFSAETAAALEIVAEDTTSFKAWLAAQYAAGTPVTVWYVLAEAETEVVNEPLMKIGDYADSISKTQSNLPIPITTGSNTLSIETTIQPSNITIDYNKQTEIAEVYGGIGENYPIYYMNRTIEGTSPIMFKGLGKDLKDYLICGNTIQNGTPTPDAPVDAAGCGVRTGNLFDSDVLLEAVGWTKDNNVYSGYSSRLHSAFNSFDKCIPVDATVVNMSVMFRYANLNTPLFIVFWYTDGTKTQFSQKGKPGEWAYLSGDSDSNKALKGVAFSYGTNDLVELKEIMVNSGSTPPSTYIPYGYKIPISSASTTTPVYLGEVETTRKIKKLVLTGEEEWKIWEMSSSSETERFYINTSGAGYAQGICSHFQFIHDSRYPHFRYGGTNFNELLFWIDKQDASTIADFKSYLAAQYTAGTPVTVWYVLKVPETAVVNEPLHKIGNYADTISMTQASITIPTVAGNNTLTIPTTVSPSSISINGNIKPEDYGQLLDVNNIEIYDKNGTSIFIKGGND